MTCRESETAPPAPGGGPITVGVPLLYCSTVLPLSSVDQRSPEYEYRFTEYEYDLCAIRDARTAPTRQRGGKGRADGGQAYQHQHVLAVTGRRTGVQGTRCRSRHDRRVGTTVTGGCLSLSGRRSCAQPPRFALVLIGDWRSSICSPLYFLLSSPRLRVRSSEQLTAYPRRTAHLCRGTSPIALRCPAPADDKETNRTGRQECHPYHRCAMFSISSSLRLRVFA